MNPATICLYTISTVAMNLHTYLITCNHRPILSETKYPPSRYSSKPFNLTQRIRRDQFHVIAAAEIPILTSTS